MILITIIFLPIILGMLNYLFHSRYMKSISIVCQLLIVFATGYLFFIEDLQHRVPMIVSLGSYEQPYGINLVADPISALLLFVASLIFLMVMLYDYNEPYMNGLFFFLTHLLEGVTFALFLVQDLFSIYAIIEVSNLVVSILIMYKKDEKAMYDGIVYLLVNVIAMAFFLMGIGVTYKIFGTMNLLTLKNLVTLAPPETLILPFTFLITGISTKVLFLPVFGWLTKAHVTDSAPYIVSALLSGLFIKTGIYLFVRIYEIFGSVLNVNELFMVMAFITAISAAIIAALQNDIKHLLAYSTVSQVSFILFGITLNTDYAYYGAVYHIVNHSIFKTLLFLCAGNIIDYYGTRKMDKISGVFKAMPITGIAMALALLGITGAPFFNGSISKYLIQPEGTIGEGIMIFINLFTIGYSFKIAKLLFGKGYEKSKTPIHRNLILMFLGIICFAGGFASKSLVQTFFQLKLNWTWVDYLEKGLIYAASLTLIGIMSKVLSIKASFIHLVRHVDLSFNELVFGTVALFFGLLVYMNWFGVA